MQNGTITSFLPYNILSSSNLVVTGQIQGVLRVLEHPPPLNFQSGNFPTIILYTITPPVSDMLVPAPSKPECIPLPI